MLKSDKFNKGLSLLEKGFDYLRINDFNLAKECWCDAIKKFDVCKFEGMTDFYKGIIDNNILNCYYNIIVANIKEGDLNSARENGKKALKYNDIRYDTVCLSIYANLLSEEEFLMFKKVLNV